MRPELATVATSGQYDDLEGAPAIPAAQVNTDWNASSGVAMIENKPDITAAQVNADWSALSGVAMIENKPSLSPVAISGDYADLTNKPTIPPAQANSDWNATSGLAMILNKPTSLGGSSGLHIELGYQPNERGIDKDDHYEPDFTMATNTFGGFQFTVNSNNSTSVPAGMYMVEADAEINATAEDEWQMPAQIVISVCQGYGWPGVPQQAVRRYPDVALATQTKGGRLGSLVVSGPLPIGSDDHVWAGFSKVTGPTTQTTLMIRGRLSLTKVS
ncbi:hypothetical protein [Caballeronia sp. INDeC2]|uniref:hypothetical protein n=1 Tax=Caballeronia sp. INDeC2 TaxID=2921747 RepID=UPI002027C98B|nr:hypothetical protein [Caballeronia sp. INDeC2]